MSMDDMTTTTTQWYYQSEEGESGPYPETHMQQWLEDGFFTLGNLVRAYPSGEYQTIESLGESGFITVNDDTERLSPLPKTEESLTNKKEDKRKRKREKAAKELVDSERSYVNSLTQLMATYVQPICSNSIITLTEQQQKLLFSNIATIVHLNTNFLMELEGLIDNYSDDTTVLGKSIMDFTPYFKTYKLYVNNYGAALGLLSGLHTKSKKFATFLDSKSTTLESLLIMPVQRIPRYKMLLTELLDLTPETHIDYENLKKSLDSISDVAIGINEAVRDFENQQEVFNIQKQFIGNVQLIAPHRTYIRQGVLTKLRPNRQIKKYTFFLFSDLLIYGVRQIGKYKLKRTLPIDKWFFVEQVSDNEYNDCFQLVSSKKSVVVFAQNDSEKKIWLEALDECIQQFNVTTQAAQQSHSLIKVDDPLKITNCRLCNEEFGTQLRKFHCHNCGKIVCRVCSRDNVALKKDGEKMRACIQCMGKTDRQQKIVSAPKDKKVKVSKAHLDLMASVAQAAKTKAGTLRANRTPRVSAAMTTKQTAPWLQEVQNRMNVVVDPNIDSDEEDDDNDDDNNNNSMIVLQSNAKSPKHRHTRNESHIEAVLAMDDVNTLRDELRKAVADEDFERCVKLRDEIATMEQHVITNALNDVDKKVPQRPSVSINISTVSSTASTASHRSKQPSFSTSITEVRNSLSSKGQSTAKHHMAGWLEKRGQWRRAWKKRYCHLNPQRCTLMYADSPTDRPNGGVVLNATTQLKSLDENDKDANDCTFAIVTSKNNRTHRFRASDIDLAQQWKDAIMSYITSVKEPIIEDVVPAPTSVKETIDAETVEESEWEMYLDEASGHYYYVNIYTGESAWALPDDGSTNITNVDENQA